VQQKTLKAAHKYVSGKETGCSVFDEAQSSVFAEMLPYWISFVSHYRPPTENRAIPSTLYM